MGAIRLSTTTDAEYKRHRDYYLANKAAISARAKARYAEQGPSLRRAMQKVRELARQERLRLKSRERGPASSRAARDRAQAFVLAEKTNKPCADCGHTYPPYVLDFDHVRGTKRMDISTMVHKGRSVRMLATEISKCDLVCANCHRIRTFTRDR